MCIILFKLIQKFSCSFPRAIVEGKRHHRLVRVYRALLFGHQLTVCVKHTLCKPDAEFTGCHPSVFPEIICHTFQLLPAYKSGSVLTQEIIIIIFLLPSLLHRTAVTKTIG